MQLHAKLMAHGNILLVFTKSFNIHDVEVFPKDSSHDEET